METTQPSLTFEEGFPSFSIPKFQKQVKLCLFAKLKLMGALQGAILFAIRARETSSFVVQHELLHEEKKDVRDKQAAVRGPIVSFAQQEIDMECNTHFHISNLSAEQTNTLWSQGPDSFFGPRSSRFPKNLTERPHISVCHFEKLGCNEFTYT
ncbi:hypothetical protein HJG60_009724 [Phyllostomus discolor]|uniref:Uncharacterized protein n=1 Tax=Phyllostomus discolor TaxID=89673 RepID=A0A834B6M6_9CHIR|nr:hypothetical protein HJG60_009724 [Phyllostomus discolor]